HILATEEADRLLHEEEGRPRVDRKQHVEQFGRRFEDVAPVGGAGDIDEDVEPAERPVGGSYDGPAILDLAEIGGDEYGLGPALFQRGHLCRALFGRTAADDDAFGAPFGEKP